MTATRVGLVFSLNEDQVRELVGLAVRLGYCKAEVRRAWKKAEIKDAVRFAMTHVVTEFTDGQGSDMGQGNAKSIKVHLIVDRIFDGDTVGARAYCGRSGELKGMAGGFPIYRPLNGTDTRMTVLEEYVTCQMCLKNWKLVKKRTVS